MGSHISGSMAILYLDRFEKQYIYHYLTDGTLYIRYIDDIGTTVKNIQQAIDFLHYLNSRHNTIKFELEQPDEKGFLPILDLKIKINPEGTVQRKIFSKSASKNITIHQQSNQPTTIKTAMIRNEMKRADTNSTQNNKQESRQHIIKKLHNNGYSQQDIRTALQPRRSRNQQQPFQHSYTFRIPYISDTFNKQIRSILTRNNINARIINIKPPTIQQITTTKAKQPNCSIKACPLQNNICHATYVVYRATCNLCNDYYVGCTTRPLHLRCLEHIRAAKTHTLTSALGHHYKEKHPHDRKPNISFKILRRTEKDTLRLNIAEAYEIKHLNPIINRKTGNINAGFLA